MGWVLRPAFKGCIHSLLLITSRPVCSCVAALGCTQAQNKGDLQGRLEERLEDGLVSEKEGSSEGWVNLSWVLLPITLFLYFFPLCFSPSCPFYSLLSSSSPAVLTVLTYSPIAQIQLGQDALLDLRFAYMPSISEAAASLAPGPPPFGLEWRRQHLGKGHLLLAATPGLHEQMPAAQDGAVAFAAWDDDDPWGPWTGNGTLWLPAVQPFQEGTYLATVHLPYLQGQVALELSVQSELGYRDPHG